MAEVDRQTRDAFGNISGPMMPPRAENASLPQEKKLDISDVPGLERPLKAGPNDVIVGEDELGNLIYYNPTRNFKYTVSLNPDQRTSRKRFQEDVVPEVKKYLSDPSLPSGKQALDFGKALITGAYDSIEGAVSGEGTYGDLLDTAGTATLGSQAIKARGTSTASAPTESVREVTTENLSSPPLEIDVTDLFKNPTMNPSEWFDSQILNLEDQRSWAGPSFKEGVEAKLTAINALGKDQLLALAENMPHYNDPGLKGYNKNLDLIADSLNIYPPHLKELLNDLSMAYPKKPDPGLQDLTGTNLPLKAPIGERGSPTGKTRSSDKKAEALGFKDTVYHTTLNEDGFTKFDVDKSLPGHGKAAQDYLGVHVGTPRAAAERNFGVGASKDNPAGQTLELRARTDKPLTGEGLAKILGLSPEDYHLGLKKEPFTEEEIGYFISDYEDLFVKNNPNFRGDPRELATKELRKKLAENDYTHIPYINSVEDAGSTSFIMLVDRPKNSPAVLRDVRAKFDPKKITDPDLRFAKGGLAENTMERQMNKLFAEGGINTQETNVDPVSGNEVPPGSLPSEVRDDIDAKLSGGEYVVPADVLRYYGVSFFEKLRKKAKEGLSEMDADGRIGGGKPEEEEGDDFPFSVEELETEDEVAFAEGGMTQAPKATGFNFDDFSYGSTNVMGQTTSGTQIKKYKDKDGNVVQVLFIDGKPVIDVDALGYTEYKEETPVATGEDVKAPEVQKESSSDRDPPPDEAKGGTGGNAKGWAEKNYDAIEADPLGFGMNALKDTTGGFASKALGGVGALAGIPALAALGGIVKSTNAVQNIAEASAASVRAKAQGLDTTELDKAIEDAVNKLPGGPKFAVDNDLAGTGNNYLKGLEEVGRSRGTTPPVPPSTSGLISKPAGSTGSRTPSGGGASKPPASPAKLTSGGGGSDKDSGYQAPPATKTVSTPSGTKAVNTTPTTTGTRSYTAPTTQQLRDQKATSAGINVGAYNAATSTKKGTPMAKGGLVEKPQKVAKTKTTRKTKI